VRRDIFPRIGISAVSWLLEFDSAGGWCGSVAHIRQERGGIAPQACRCRRGMAPLLAFRADQADLKAAA